MHQASDVNPSVLIRSKAVYLISGTKTDLSLPVTVVESYQRSP